MTIAFVDAIFGGTPSRSVGNALIGFLTRATRTTGDTIPVTAGNYDTLISSIDDGVNPPWKIVGKIAEGGTLDNIVISGASLFIIAAYSGNFFDGHLLGNYGLASGIGVGSPILYGNQAGSGFSFQHASGSSWPLLFTHAVGSLITPKRTVAPGFYTDRAHDYRASGETAAHDLNAGLTGFTNVNGPSFAGTTNYVSVAMELMEYPAGYLNVTLNADTLDSTAEHGQLPIKGNLDVTLNPDTLTAEGQHTITGSAVITLKADTLDATGEHENRGVLDVLLAADTLTSSGLHGNSGSLSVTLNPDTLTTVTEHGPMPPIHGNLNVTLKPDTLISEAVSNTFMLGIDGCTNGYTPVATQECCIQPICNIEPCELICQFVNLLPTGPMWDVPKKTVSDYFSDPEICTTGTVIPPNLLSKNMCSSLVVHSVYSALKLHDLLKNALWPALRESDPYTAFDTMDDWLDKLGWVDCMQGPCRDPTLGNLTPLEVGTPCGSQFCEIEYPECLTTTVKHAILVSLARVKRGIVPNIASLNWLIEPFHARLTPLNLDLDEDGEVHCPLRYEIAPLTDSLPLWQRDDCATQTPQFCQAYFEPNTCAQTGLPDRIYPGLLAATCIVSSLLLRCGSVKIVQRCDVPTELRDVCAKQEVLH